MAKLNVLKPGQYVLSEAEVKVMTMLKQEGEPGNPMNAEILQVMTGYSREELSQVTKSLVRKGLLIAIQS